MPLGLAIGAGVGLLKAETVDKAKQNRQIQLAAATQRNSPWTGLQAQPVQYADPFGSALQFGGTGAALNSAMNQSAATTNYLNAKTADGSFSGMPGVPSMSFNAAPSYNLGANSPWNVSSNPFQLQSP